MSRQFFRRIAARFEPATARITGNPWVRKYLPALADPDLWYFNRRSTARGVAIGLLCGLIPGPLQALGSGALCLVFRGNFPLAVLTTFYTNPLTIVPLYVVAYEYGRLFVPSAAGTVRPGPPDFAFDPAGFQSFLHWAGSLGAPLAVGLPLLAFTLAAIGYVCVLGWWRWDVLRAWRRRSASRAGRSAGAR